MKGAGARLPCCIALLGLVGPIGACRARHGAKSFELPKPAAPRGEPVELRYKLAAGQRWLYDVEVHSTVVSNSGVPIGIQVNYTLDMVVDSPDREGAAQVDVSFRDYKFQIVPSAIDAVQIPDLSHANIHWRLAADGSVRDVRITDGDPRHPANRGQLAMLEGALEAAFRLNHAPVRANVPWSFARGIPFAMPYSTDVLTFDARYTAWVDQASQGEANIILTTLLDLPPQTVRASAFLIGMEGDLQMTSDGRAVSKIAFDRERGTVKRVGQRVSIKTFAVARGTKVEALTSVDSTMSLRDL